jgi:hypothetical protein
LRRNTTNAVIVLAVVATLGVVVTVVYERNRTNLESRYEALRQGQVNGAAWVDVDRQTYEDWLAVVNNPDRYTTRTNDAFSARFASLPDAGFSADIDGYLKLLAADLPEPETLSIFELNRWCDAAGLRVLFCPLKVGGRRLYVYREGGVVRGFRLPSCLSDESFNLGILENGFYAEYLSVPKEDSESD